MRYIGTVHAFEYLTAPDRRGNMDVFQITIKDQGPQSLKRRFSIHITLRDQPMVRLSVPGSGVARWCLDGPAWAWIPSLMRKDLVRALCDLEVEAPMPVGTW